MNFWILFITVLGGFQFGYNTGIISGALLFVAKAFSLGAAEEGVLVSTLLLGALIGACFGGVLADRWGRRKTIIASAALFLIGTLLAAFSPGIDTLLAARFITGLAVGITSFAAPLYLSEMATAGKRGAIVSVNQLATTVGILVAYGVNFIYSGTADWRMMFGLGAILAAVQGVGMFFLPETPRWLSLRKGEAKFVQGWKALFQPGVRRFLAIGILLNIFQQITGINTVIYYAPKIFQIAGVASNSLAILATIGIGSVNVAASLIAVWLLDRAGRKPLLLVGIFGMVVCLLTVAMAFSSHSPIIDKIAFFSLMGYVFFFAIGLGAVTAVVLSEIYPAHIRGRAMSIATFANWLFNYLVSLTFLDLMKHLGSSGTFGLYAIFGVLSFWFVYRYIPETKGRSLENIESHIVEKR